MQYMESIKGLFPECKQVLRVYFNNDRNDFSAMDVSIKTGLGLTSVSKYLNILEKNEIVYKMRESNKGVGFYRISSAALNAIVEDQLSRGVKIHLPE